MDIKYIHENLTLELNIPAFVTREYKIIPGKILCQGKLFTHVNRRWNQMLFITVPPQYYTITSL
jgi:hypothetical protein